MITPMSDKKVATRKKVARVAQALCVGGASLIPIIVIRKFATLDLTQDQLWFGAVATVTVSLLFAVIAMLFEFHTKEA
jgi:hypothetical protein